MDRFINHPSEVQELYDLAQRTIEEGPDFYDIIDEIFKKVICLWNKEHEMVPLGTISREIMELLGRPEATKLFSIIEEEIQWWGTHTHKDDKRSEHWFALAGSVIDLFRAEAKQGIVN